MRMCVSNTSEPHLELAVDVFKTQNPALVRSLKDFMTVLPSPKCVEDVLTAALYQLAETEPDACRWLLRNPDYLMPELDLLDLGRNFARTWLENQGLVVDRDFRFEPSDRLDINKRAKAALMVGISAGNRLLLEEILQIRD